MLKQGVEFEEVFDKFAIRIIVQAKPQDEKAFAGEFTQLLLIFISLIQIG